MRWVLRLVLLSLDSLNGGGGSLVKVFACGDNSHGQLGLGNIRNKNDFTLLPRLPD